MAPYLPTLAAQFTEVRPMTSSSSALHLVFATGRRNVLAVHATLKLMPLHDVIQLVWNTVNSVIDPLAQTGESLIFQFTLGRGASGLQGEAAGVWAIVNKTGMAQVREQRFDLVSS